MHKNSSKSSKKHRIDGTSVQSTRSHNTVSNIIEKNPRTFDTSKCNDPYEDDIVKTANMIKVVVVGESGAGKSNLIQRLVDDRFDPRSKSTIGIDFAMYEFEDYSTMRNNGKSEKSSQRTNLYKAQIWDTAGQERYRSSMTKIFYRDVVGALLVFDLTNREHYFALNRWYDEIRSNVHFSSDDGQVTHQMEARIPIVLVGNKLDQTEHNRAIQTSEALEFVRRHRLSDYVETSAKTSANVEKAFKLLFKHIMIQRSGGIHEDDQKKEKTKHGSRRKPIQREASIKLGYGSDRKSQHLSPKPKKQNKCNC